MQTENEHLNTVGGEKQQSFKHNLLRETKIKYNSDYRLRVCRLFTSVLLRNVEKKIGMPLVTEDRRTNKYVANISLVVKPYYFNSCFKNTL